MLNNIIGKVNSGKSLILLDKIVNSKYDNVLLINTENFAKHTLNRLKNYTTNTGKLIVNKIHILDKCLYEFHEIEPFLLKAVEENKDCIAINGFNNYDLYSLKQFSKEHNIDIFITTQAKNYSDLTFDEVIKNVELKELEEGVEEVIVYKSNLESGTTFIKLFERRKNLIRSVSINHYFKKEENEVQ